MEFSWNKRYWNRLTAVNLQPSVRKPTSHYLFVAPTTVDNSQQKEIVKSQSCGGNVDLECVRETTLCEPSEAPAAVGDIQQKETDESQSGGGTVNFGCVGEPTLCDPSEAPTAVSNIQQIETITSQSGCSQVVNSQPKPCYQLKIPSSEIVWVDSWSGFEECVETISKHDVVGIDVEFMRKRGPQKAAVIQIATRQQIFIVDVPALAENGQVDVPENRQLSSHQQGSMLIDKLFANIKICKLFFGMNCDLRAIAISLPGCEPLSYNSTSRSNIVDLLCVYQRIQDGYSHLFPYPEPVGKMKGLSKMVSRCFGVPLKKGHRYCDITDWERRPLLPCELSYAALDAYCLVEIYDFLRSKTEASVLNDLLRPPLKNQPRAASSSTQVAVGQPSEQRGVKRKAEELENCSINSVYHIRRSAADALRMEQQIYCIRRSDHMHASYADALKMQKQKDEAEIQVVEYDIQVQAESDIQVQANIIEIPFDMENEIQFEYDDEFEVDDDIQVIYPLDLNNEVEIITID